MNNLLTAIMSKITTGPSALYSDVSGRVFLDQAPPGVEFPYIVFFIVSNTPDDVFAQKGEDVLIQFSLFSNSEGAAEITDMYADLKALFDDAQLTVTSSTMIIMRRENLTTMVDEITTPTGTVGIKHWAVDYRIALEYS